MRCDLSKKTLLRRFVLSVCLPLVFLLACLGVRETVRAKRQRVVQEAKRVGVEYWPAVDKVTGKSVPQSGWMHRLAASAMLPPEIRYAGVSIEGTEVDWRTKSESNDEQQRSHSSRFNQSAKSGCVSAFTVEPTRNQETDFLKMVSMDSPT